MDFGLPNNQCTSLWLWRSSFNNTPHDLSPIRENLVTTAAASTSDNYQHESSKDSSDYSELEGVKWNPTTIKKSATVTSPISGSILFTIIMVDFDKSLTEVLDVWLGASSLNHKIQLMSETCDIKTACLRH